jgi:hypothetical protein
MICRIPDATADQRQKVGANSNPSARGVEGCPPRTAGLTGQRTAAQCPAPKFDSDSAQIHLVAFSVGNSCFLLFRGQKPIWPQTYTKALKNAPNDIKIFKRSKSYTQVHFYGSHRHAILIALGELTTT